MSERTGLELLELAVLRLGDIVEELVFVGGATLGLHITDPAVSEPRMTDDVDTIVPVATALEYSKLCERLIEVGFSPSMDVDCRWSMGELIVDVMPTDARILGFSNEWYAPAIEHAQSALVAGRMIRHIDAPHFLATKICAFRGRGREDFQMSHDLEDIVRVIHGRSAIVYECATASEPLRRFLIDHLGEFLATDRFVLSIEGHLSMEGPGQGSIVLRRIGDIISAAS